MEDISNTNFSFDLPKNRSNVIKVIGVGGGGSNAINYMFQQGINGVDFVICNTDAQALQESPVPIKIQLGATLTEGLGAGANPEVGAKAAEESLETLKALLETQTKMIFITAGMGGGTGTGAAPILARMAKQMDILTVGIVTMPFQFEGKLRLDQAQKGLDNLRQEVDSLIVINNNKLREVYGNLGFKSGFAKADEVLATAARGIAEVITHHYTQNIDLKDAKTVLTNSGTAIMGSSLASGANRAQEAIVNALDSPLLNDNKIKGCKNVLLLIVSGTEEITIDEIGEINDFIQDEAGHNANIIMGVGEDENLGTAISVTVIATGFNADQQHEIVNSEAKKIIHNLEEDQVMQHNLGADQPKTLKPASNIESQDPLDAPLTIKEETVHAHHLIFDEEEVDEETAHLQPESVTTIPTQEENTPRELFQLDVEDIDVEDPILVNSDDAEPAEAIAFSQEEIPTDEVPSYTEDELHNLDVIYEIIAAPSIEEQGAETDDEATTSPTASTMVIEEEMRQEIEDESFSLEFDPVVSEEISDFVINDLDENIMEMEVVDEEEIVSEKEAQITFDFDLPILSVDAPQKEQKPDFIAEEQDLQTPIKHNLETVFQETEEVSFAPRTKQSEAPLALEDKKAQEKVAETDSDNPFERSIQQSVRIENEKRKAQLKKFNYVFKSNLHKIEELERQPAYKRQGIDLEESSGHADASRMSVDRDSNDEIQLRSNNSYLHDNVD